MIEILQLIIMVTCGALSLIFAMMAWKIFKCPDSLWKEMQRTPYHKSGPLYDRFWGCK